MNDAWKELDSCSSVLLSELTETRLINSLRIVVSEVMRLTDVPVAIPGLKIGGAFPIGVTDQSRRFEITWERYVLYSVVNESYDVRDDQSVLESGNRLLRYSGSRFLTYVRAETLVNCLEQAPLQHHCLVSEHHVIHVASNAAPRVALLP